MKKLHVVASICSFLLLCGIFESCGNNAVKEEETTTRQETVTECENYDSVTDEEDLTEQKNISPIADTICIVDGNVFYFGIGEIFDKNKVWLEAPALEVFPYSNSSSYKFYVRTPYKCLLVDFSDESSLAQLSSLTAVLSSFERKTQSFVEQDSIAWYDFEMDFPTSSITNAKAIRKWLVGKIAESNRDYEDIPFPIADGLNYKKGPDGLWEYKDDLKDNQKIAQFAADVYFAIIKVDFGDLIEELIPIGLSRTLNMQAKMCNNRLSLIRDVRPTMEAVRMVYTARDCCLSTMFIIRRLIIPICLSLIAKRSW